MAIIQKSVALKMNTQEVATFKALLYAARQEMQKRGRDQIQGVPISEMKKLADELDEL